MNSKSKKYNWFIRWKSFLPGLLTLLILGLTYYWSSIVKEWQTLIAAIPTAIVAFLAYRLSLNNIVRERERAAPFIDIKNSGVKTRISDNLEFKVLRIELVLLGEYPALKVSCESCMPEGEEPLFCTLSPGESRFRFLYLKPTQQSYDVQVSYYDIHGNKWASKILFFVNGADVSMPYSVERIPINN